MHSVIKIAIRVTSKGRTGRHAKLRYDFDDVFVLPMRSPW